MVNNGRVISAVRTDAEFKLSLTSGSKLIFDLSPNINNISERADKAHLSGKSYLIHIDLAEGIGKDRYGMEYAASQGVDGIISTRVNIIKTARELGLKTVQRFFIVDSHSVETTVEAIKSSKPHMIEVMPGIVPKIIKSLKEKVNMPIIAGGLIDDFTEVKLAVESGAYAVSTGKTDLW